MRILLIAYDNDSYVSYFPLGIAYIAAVCRNAGHDVEIYHQDIYHWLEQHLTDQLDRIKYDVVGIGVIGGYYQYRKLLKIAEAINRSKQRPFFIIGGYGPSPEPEFFLRKTGADIVVIGESEITIVELLDCYSRQSDLSDIKGIAFIDRVSGKFIQTEERELIKDLDSILYPAWDLFPMEFYALYRTSSSMLRTDRCALVLSGRGCNFKCNFCYRMDKGLRTRFAHCVIDEIKLLKERYAINYVSFFDELFMDSKKRVQELCALMLQEKLDIRWDCAGRLNYATPEILELMKKAGCVFIGYGIESLDNDILRRMNKVLTVNQITAGIENTIAAGIDPGFNIIFGHLGDTADSLKLSIDFLKKYDNHANLRTIRPVTPYPGSPLYYYAIEKGLLDGPEDFYERKHINSDLLTVNFTELSNDEVHELLRWANSELVRKYYSDIQNRTLTVIDNLYRNKDASFRGFRPV